MKEIGKVMILPVIPVALFMLFFIYPIFTPVYGDQSGINKPGNIAFKSNAISVDEDAGEVSVELVRENGSDGELSTVVLFGGSRGTDTATVDLDYRVPDPVPNILTWKDGEDGIKTIKVPILQDSKLEGDEFFTVFFTRNGASSLEEMKVTIIDVHKPGDIHFKSQKSAISEAEAEISLTIVREGGTDGPVVVDVVVGDQGDSAESGRDYGVPSVTQLTWGDGDDQEKTVKIPIIADGRVEGEETLTVRLVQDGTVLDVVNFTITDASSDTNAPGAAVIDGLEIISGDRQRFDPVLSFEDLVVKVLFTKGEAFSGVPIDWTVKPDNSGNLEATRTLTNAQGESSNRFTATTTRRVVVRATVRLSQADATGRRLQARAEADPFVEFVINPAIADTRGLTGNQENVAVALDVACPALENKAALTAGEQDLQATCRELQSSDPALVAESLSRLAHEEVTTQGTVLVETGNLQVMNVNARLNAIRAGATGGLNVSGLNIRFAGQALPHVLVDAMLGGGASAGDGSLLSSPWSGFINGDISLGNKSGTVDETGFDFSALGVTAGLDYRASATTVVGVSLGYGSNNSDLENDSGLMDMTGLYFTAYGTYYQNDRIYIDGLVKLGMNNFDTQRRVSKFSDPLQLAQGDTDGKEYSFSLGGGYDYNWGAMTLTPYGRLSYVTAAINGYTETASNPGGKGSGSVLVIQGQDIDSLTTVMGGQVSYAISKPGSVYLPQLRFEWEHEFKDDSRSISAHFVHDPSHRAFSIASGAPDRNYFNLGLGFSAVAPHGKSGFLYYETRIDQDNVEQHWLKGGFRIEF